MILYSRSVASGGWVTTFLHPAGTSSSESSFTAMSSKVSMQRTSRADDRANKSKHMNRSSPSHVPSTSFVPLPLPPPSCGLIIARKKKIPLEPAPLLIMNSFQIPHVLIL